MRFLRAFTARLLQRHAATLVPLLIRLGAFEPLRASGEVTITLRDSGGDVVGELVQHNLVVSSGLAHLCQLLIGGTTNTPNYIELGTGTTTPAATDTALATPNTGTWHAIDVKSDYLTYYAQFETLYNTATANGTWTELGLFAGANTTPGTGTLIAHVLVPSWTKTSAQTATVTWRLLIST